MTPRRLRTVHAIWARVVWGKGQARGVGGAAHRVGRGATDDGSAMIEFVGLSVVLLVPFVYLFLCVFAVQKSAFGVTQAAREAGRAFATADSETQGADRARLAAALSLQDQGVSGQPQVHFAPAGANCGAGNPGDGAQTLEPGASFVICVRTVVALPGTGALFAGITDVTVNGQFTVVIDQFRADRREAQP
ncbi:MULTISPECIES: hypothetical protein [Frankia]|uniref:Pilus assembly protein n=1 Tax=Frankia alni (strain DSM 45986 / CECT 9034 / ACN14a) TaxID=326424 RepID=Q0RR38_FRAAA|nr:MULTISPECIES: hypothetical protein [Frankia]CAJ59985.1 hypothetical protein FRAAL1324 [Frankia alni ACN14a]